MSSHASFLGGIDLAGVTLARVDERESIATYSELIKEVRALCGLEVASLFAEPIKGTNRTTGANNVAWYSEIEGTPFLLGQLDRTASQPVVDLLRQRLRSFSSLLGNPKYGAVLGSWLHVLSEDSIMAISGQPVIRHWGMVPEAVSRSEEARDTHFRRIMGDYLPNLPTPPFTGVEAQSFAGRMAQVAERESARAVHNLPPRETPAPPPPMAAAPAPTGKLWLAPAWACAAAGLVLLLLAFGHLLRYPALREGSDDAAIEAQRRTNSALQQRLDQLKKATAAELCPIPGTGQRTAIDPETLLPPSPTQTRITATEPGKAQPEILPLGSVLNRATVLVLAGDSLGSGFFISDRHILTNHHVVGGLNAVKVGNQALGAFVPARVLAVGTGASRGTQDLAVLEVPPQPKAAFLRVGSTPLQLTQVTAAGFPGAVLETIERSPTLPEVNFTQGIVTSRQVQAPDGIATIIHTAQIGHGNSGGPLVDPGGCAVGVNSWLNVDEVDHVIFSTYFQALDASELRTFLKANNIAFGAVDAPCSPVAPPVATTQPPRPTP